LDVVGAGKFKSFVQGAPKRYGRRPGHRKSAYALNSDLDLQPHAFVVGIGGWSIIRVRELEILFCIPSIASIVDS